MTATQAFTLSYNLAFVQGIKNKLFRVGNGKWGVTIVTTIINEEKK